MKLLIADSDVRFTDAISMCMRPFQDMELFIEHNGVDVLKRLRSERMDAVLMEMAMPGIDGITILRNISEMRDAPVVLCCSRFYSDVMFEAACAYGAAMMLYKPVELTSLHELVITCVEMNRNAQAILHNVISDNTSAQTRDAFIRNYIVSLGIPTKLVGCTYLTEAVRLAMADITLTQNLSKGLYTEIARSMNSSPSRVERSIRSAIGIAYQRGELRSRLPACPSNREFIHYVLQKLQV